MDVHLGHLRGGLQFLSDVAVGGHEADHDRLAFGLEVMGEELGPSDVVFTPASGVVRIGGQGAEVVAIHMEGLDALRGQMRKHGLGQSGFAVTGLACEPINHPTGWAALRVKVCSRSGPTLSTVTGTPTASSMNAT